MFTTPFLEKLSLHARHALKESRDIASYSKSRTIEPKHLLLAIFLENGSLGSFLLENIGFEKERLGKICLKHKKSERLPARFIPSLSPATRTILRNAYQLAHTRSFPYVGTEHIVSALINSDNEDIHLVTGAFEIDLSKAVSSLENHLHFEHFPELPGLFETSENILSRVPSKKRSGTPGLDQFATDTKTQDKQNILVGREMEIDRLITILSRRTKNNPLLIGEPGVGKTALVAALADRISQGEVPPSLLGKRILSLDLALIVAGTNFRGEFETRLKDIMAETKAHTDIILFIDEIHTLVGAGNANGSLDAANILKPALARGDIRCIGATTFTEYKKYIEKDAALERRFQPLIIREPTAEETIDILEASKSLYENHHRVALSPGNHRTHSRSRVPIGARSFLPRQGIRYPR
jgi:ATP-dependent Clp protease ATP-binding subunit ClpC